MTNEELETALKGTAVEIRNSVTRELASAKVNARLTAVVGAVGTVFAAAVSAGATFFIATSELTKITTQAEIKIGEIAAQASTDMVRSAHQKLLEQVFAQQDRIRLRDSFALLVMGKLVEGPFFDGICEVIKTSLDDPPLDCAKAARLIIRPSERMTGQAQEAVVSAIGAGGEILMPGTPPATAPLAQITPDLARSIEALGDEERVARFTAARKLSDHLNNDKIDLRTRLVTFAALVRTTALPVYTRLNLNARYNTFVVLSEIQPLRDQAGGDPGFQQLAGNLLENAEAILAAAADTPDLAGEQTRRQIQQVVDRLAKYRL